MTPLERAPAMSREQVTLANMAVGQVLKFETYWTYFIVERTGVNEWSLDKTNYESFWAVWDVLSKYNVTLVR